MPAPGAGPRAAVFLDRDGTLIVEKHYLHRPEEVEIFPEAAPALRAWIEIGESISRAGCKKLVIANSHGGNNALIDVVMRELRVRSTSGVTTTMPSLVS